MSERTVERGQAVITCDCGPKKRPAERDALMARWELGGRGHVDDATAAAAAYYVSLRVSQDERIAFHAVANGRPVAERFLSRSIAAVRAHRKLSDEMTSALLAVERWLTDV